MLPSNKEITQADFITAVMDEDCDFLKVFTNPNLDPEIREGDAYGTPNHLEVRCNNPDELFALKAIVRELRGKVGVYTKEERQNALERLYEKDCTAFGEVYFKRMKIKLDPNEQISLVLAGRMIGDILEREHAGE